MRKIIIKYLNDKISNEELEMLKTWLLKAKNQEKFKDYVRLNHDMNSLHSEFDVKSAYQKVFPKVKKKPNYFNIFKYAAILVGVGLIGYGVFEKFTNTGSTQAAPQITLQLEDGTTKVIKEDQTIVIVSSTGKKVTEQKKNELVYANNNAETLQYNKLKVPFGKTFGITLSDGSKVMLNAGSELKYPVAFIESEKNRTVYLNGEAYFEVSKDGNHPFIVDTEDMKVEVLGTQFNVTSYIEDDKTYTVLVEGKVAAHNKISDGDTKTLSPNTKVYFNGDKLETENVAVEKYVAWAQGELVFIDDSFSVIKNKLERKFNVSINNEYRELDDISITARFKNETLEQVLKTFQSYITFDYNIKNGVVNISEPK